MRGAIILLIMLLAAAVAFGQTEPAAEARNEQTSHRPGAVAPSSDLNGTRGDVIVDDAGSAYPTTGVLLKPKPGWPSIVAQTGTTDASSAFRVFNSSQASALMTVLGNGKVGIGQTSPATTLDIKGGVHPLRVQGENGSGWAGVIAYDGAAVGLGPGGVTLALEGPSELRAGAIQLGFGGGSIINSLGLPLYLNRWVDYDVYVGNSAFSNSGLKVESTGPSYFLGKLGFGTTTPATKVHVVVTDASTPRGVLVDQFTSDAAGAVFVARKARGTPQAPQAVANGDNVGIFMAQPYDGTSYLLPARMFFTVDGNVATNNVPTAIRFTTGANAEIERMRITSGGTVGIGTTTPDPAYKLDVAGNIKAGEIIATRVLGAVYQDLAEWVPATEDLTPGTVVVLNPERSNEVMPSARSYDTTVAGVVSAQPGIILGEGGPSKEQIATTGRVRVRVDATAAPIRIGDLLVTGTKPGVAMKSIPIDLQGIAFHRPGTVLGKALEPLDGGEGEILVLLSLQ